MHDEKTKSYILMNIQQKVASSKIVPIDSPDGGGSKPVATEADPTKPIKPILSVSTVTFAWLLYIISDISRWEIFNITR